MAVEYFFFSSESLLRMVLRRLSTRLYVMTLFFVHGVHGRPTVRGDLLFCVDLLPIYAHWSSSDALSTIKRG
jgi:hypothetical protein